MAANPESTSPSMQAPAPVESLQDVAAPEPANDACTCALPNCGEAPAVCLACYSVEALVADRLQAHGERIAVLQEACGDATKNLHEAVGRAEALEQQLHEAQAKLSRQSRRLLVLEDEVRKARARRSYDLKMWDRLARLLGMPAGSTPEEMLQRARFETLLEFAVRETAESSA